MSLSQSLLPEFDHEMANARKVLVRIPEDKLNWKVHEKSNTIGWVGMHMAGILGWVDLTLNRDSLDIAPAGAEPSVGAAHRSQSVDQASSEPATTFAV